MGLNATTAMLGGLALAYILGAFSLHPAVILATATLSIAVPVTMRELGWLRDHDELQLEGQRRGALWAFLMLLALAPIYLLLDASREEFAGRSLEGAITLFALVYLLESRGARSALRTLLGIGAVMAVAYGASLLPDMDRLAAMLLVAGLLGILAWLAGRLPLLAAIVLAVLWVLRLMQSARNGPADLAVYLPSAVIFMVMIVALVRAARVPDDPEVHP